MKQPNSPRFPAEITVPDTVARLHFSFVVELIENHSETPPGVVHAAPLPVSSIKKCGGGGLKAMLDIGEVTEAIPWTWY